MTKRQKIEKKYNSLVYNHLWLKWIIENGYALIVTAFSSAIFSLGVNIFLKPLTVGVEAVEMVSGGSSGVAQVIDKILTLCNVSLPAGFPTIYSICFVLVNLPLIYLAIRKIGKRFGIFTMINVGLVFVFTNLFKGSAFTQMAEFINNNGGLITRALFAGVCTGLSSALAYHVESSAGGFDIISYYLSEKKSTTTGKYIILVNGGIILAFAILSSISGNPDGSANWGQGLGGIWFSIIYLITVMLVVDVINVRNKKAKITIVTDKEKLGSLLLANIPHGATLQQGKGAYTGNEKYIVTMVVSTLEVKKVIKVAKQLDDKSFIEVTTLQQVYGHFHTKTIK